MKTKDRVYIDVGEFFRNDERLNLEMIRSFQILLYSICIILASEASQKKKL